MYLKNKIKSILATERSKALSDVTALQKLTALSNSYIPWTSSSVRPSAIVKILNDILINNRKNIIEFGAGVSTLYIAKILKENGGHLQTVEHDSEWIEIVKEMLRKNGTDDMVSFVHAPMNKCRLSLDGLAWYDEGALNSIMGDVQFDLVFIDGPLAYTKELRLSRYPALPFLMNLNKVKENVTIILDDINRSGEQEIIDLWEINFGFKFVKLFDEAGVAISQNGKFYNI